MIHVLVTGALAGKPQARTSAKGTIFAISSVRSGSGEDAVFVNIVAFSEQTKRLLELKKGDAVSIAGRGELKSWKGKDGTERTSLSIIASEIAATRPRPRPRNAAPWRSHSAPPPSFDGPPLDDPVDDLYAGGPHA